MVLPWPIERVGLEMVVGGKAGVEGGTLEGRLRRYLGFDRKWELSF